MLLNIAIGLPVMALCLFLQTLLLLVATRYYVRRETLVRSPSFGLTFLVLGGVMLILVLGNIAQTGIWALLFLLLGEFMDYSTAFYHSAVNFATLGYGDLVMSPKHRLLGPLEAINGVLMIGLSTAVLLTAFQDALKKTAQARNRSGMGIGIDLDD